MGMKSVRIAVRAEKPKKKERRLIRLDLTVRYWYPETDKRTPKNSQHYTSPERAAAFLREWAKLIEEGRAPS